MKSTSEIYTCVVDAYARNVTTLVALGEMRDSRIVEAQAAASLGTLGYALDLPGYDRMRDTYETKRRTRAFSVEEALECMLAMFFVEGPPASDMTDAFIEIRSNPQGFVSGGIRAVLPGLAGERVERVVSRARGIILGSEEGLIRNLPTEPLGVGVAGSEFDLWVDSNPGLARYAHWCLHCEDRYSLERIDRLRSEAGTRAALREVPPTRCVHQLRGLDNPSPRA